MSEKEGERERVRRRERMNEGGKVGAEWGGFGY